MKYNRTTCRHTPSKDGFYPVLIRVTYNGKRLNLYTGISCDKDRWDKKRNCIKQGSKINGYEYNVLNEQIRQQEAFGLFAKRSDKYNIKQNLKMADDYTA